MRSRRRKGRRNRDGLWICGIAVLAAGAVFTVRTEILDLVTTEIAFVLDPKQEGGEKESDQDIAERVESTDGGKETLTDGGVDLAETDEAGADPDQKNTDAGTEASGSGNSDPEAIELPSSYDIREHRTVSVSDQGDLGTCWGVRGVKGGGDLYAGVHGGAALGGPHVDPQQFWDQSEFRRRLQYGDGVSFSLAGTCLRGG